MKGKKTYLQNLQHSCAHLMAAAVLELWPQTKLTIGPVIENGFYYDFDFKKPISEHDLSKIEKKMEEIVKTWSHFERIEVSENEAKKKFKDNPYKLELIEELIQQKQSITIYKSGDFEDLCRGGHIENPTKEILAFKLLSIAGAYWRGDERNKMLTRIYGTCFPTQKELDEYLWQIEEAKKRDHKKIGQELDLFSFHEEGPGFVFWHPKGMRLRQPLTDFWQKLHIETGYEEVSTPILLLDKLWKQSGHWQNYKDKMYFTKKENKTLALKPMNCPGMILIYKTRPHSYRELPIRWRELGFVHRFEPSGTLNGLLRERAFRQDDAHIFCQENQIEEEVKGVIKLALKIYSAFKFESIKIELSTRPKKFIGTREMWDKAEAILKKVLADLKKDHKLKDYKLNEGEGAFYGPKIDFHLTDSLGRPWQCGTIQLDFAMPERFDLTYVDQGGQLKRPVMIHRAIFGSIHRFFGILIEHFAGNFPLWLSPVQVIILPLADRHAKFAGSVDKELKEAGIRSEVDLRSETLQAKIRDATLQKIPYMGIIGNREVRSKEEMVVSVRTRGGKDLGQMTLAQFLQKLKEEIDKKI